VNHARETLAAVESRLSRLLLSPAEDARIRDLANVVRAILESERDR
jgi:hypothetical protein